MISMEMFLHYSLFLAACIWVALEPGPGFVKLSSNTFKHGTTGGILTAVGMQLGAFPAILLTAFGLGTLIQSSTWLLTILKILGACYLIWMGLEMLRTNDKQTSQTTRKDPLHPPVNSENRIHRLTEGFTLVAINPRTYLFYPAFLALFTPEILPYGLVVQLLLMGFAVASMFLLVDVIFVLLIRKLSHSHINFKSLSKASKLVGSGMLLAFGARLLFEKDE